MPYTNKDTFIMSANGCMDASMDSLESILAGNDEGARGCCFSVDMTADGIAVLSEEGICENAQGVKLVVSDYSYAELHQANPHLLPVGQAISLAKTCRAKIAITVRNQTLLPQLRMTLRQSSYLDNTIFVGLGLVEAARIAVANPELHIMGELPALPDNIAALVGAAHTTGLFGVRAAPKDLTSELVEACKRTGLFTMSLPTDDIDTLGRLVGLGVNFIETPRPDYATVFLPSDQAKPQQIPLIPY